MGDWRKEDLVIGGADSLDPLNDQLKQDVAEVIVYDNFAEDPRTSKVPERPSGTCL